MTDENVLSTREHLFYATCNKINVIADYLCYVELATRYATVRFYHYVTVLRKVRFEWGELWKGGQKWRSGAR